MPALQSLPIREVLRGRRISWADAVVGAGIIAILYAVVRLGQSMSVNFTPGRTPVTISTDIANVPYYAARSLLRMFIALALSTIFTLVYGTAAARLRRAEKVLVPILDILQSIPILVFLPIALTFFITLIPNNLLGLELASIFVIFTSQAWNMTFSFYHSLITQPTELDEAARMYRLTKWQRFWKLDVPSSMIGLVWNMMMSMGGGWFFLTASEAVTVFIKGKGLSESLPGIGSYMAAAVAHGSYSEVGIAIAVMVILVVGTNFFVFRPLVAWSDKFRLETSESADKPKSVILNLLRRSELPRLAGHVSRPIGRALDRITRPFGLAEYPLRTDVRRRHIGDVIFWSVILGASAAVAVLGLIYLNSHLGFARFPSLIGFGSATLARVVILLVISTLIWLPVGVKIGMSARLSRYAQPVVQVLASFPAILLFPFATLIFIDLGISLNYGAILLMMLGAQWYILFNVIAGASAIPNDLRELMISMRLTRRQRWQQVILPAIFPAYVTGGITAAGGAWNASIVAELVSWHHHTLNAYGLGNYIATASIQGKFALLIAGGIVMSAFVVIVNRLFWRRLYRMAETRFTL
ncbi:MAG: ABC transporter permease subunit [Acidimicrobiales bacterium]